MINYFFPDEDLGLPGLNTAIDDDAAQGMWAGVQQCAATVALAAVMAISAVSTVQAATAGSYHQDDPAGFLFLIADEDFWQNSVTPVPASLGKLYLPEQDEVPAGSLLTGEAEEYLWQNPTAPVPASFGKLYLPDPEEIPTGLLVTGQMEEELWQNSVRPVPLLFGPLYLPDPEEIPAGSFSGQLDDPYWFRILRSPVDLSAFGGGTTLVGPPEEDFWQNPVAPVLLTFGKLYLPDPEEIPSGVLFGQPDEDFWQDTSVIPSATAKIAALLNSAQAQVLQYYEQDDLVPAPTPLDVDDAPWTNPVAPVPSYPVPLVFVDDEIIIPNVTQNVVDEDLYAPPFNLYEDYVWQLLLFQDDGSNPPEFQPDEDFWQNQVVPVAASLGKLYLPEPEQTVASSTVGQPDEDFWQNPVAPVVASLGKLYLPDPEELTPSAVVGQPDEDFWQNQVRPAPLSFSPLYLPDPEFLPASPLVGQLDEDFWQNSVAPVQATLNRLYLFDPEEIIVPKYDDDFWQNSVSPVPLLLFQKFPYQPDPDESSIVFLGQLDEDFWQNPVAPVPLTFGRLFLPDPSKDVLSFGLSTVSGNLKNILAIADPSGTVRFSLVYFDQSSPVQPLRVISRNIIIPLTVDVPVASDGSFTVTLQRNDTIIPTPTYYAVTYYVPNGSIGPVYYQILTSIVDFDTLQSVTPS